MSGETKQLIANVRSEFNRLVLNGLYNPDVSDDVIMEGLERFEQYLASIDEPVIDQVPPLGVSISEAAPIIDKFGG